MKGYNEYLGEMARQHRELRTVLNNLLTELNDLQARADSHREYPVYPSELRELIDQYEGYRDDILA